MLASTQELSLGPQMKDTHISLFLKCQKKKRKKKLNELKKKCLDYVKGWTLLNLPLLSQAQSGKWPVATRLVGFISCCSCIPSSFPE
jgi:hypothetical protein